MTNEEIKIEVLDLLCKVVAVVLLDGFREVKKLDVISRKTIPRF